MSPLLPGGTWVMVCRSGATSERVSTLCRCFCCWPFSLLPTRGRSGAWTGSAVVVHNLRSPILHSQPHHGRELLMRLRIVAAVAGLLLCWAGGATAQAPHHVVVHAAHLLDVKSGKTLSDQTPVIEDGKIVATGASAEA